jgi:hypothetical protein
VLTTSKARSGTSPCRPRRARRRGQRSAPHVQPPNLADVTWPGYVVTEEVTPRASESARVARPPAVAGPGGVRVTEFAFTPASVGRIALSLHQAIRNHRIALPDDDVLTDKLVSVRLRKNSIGVLRLDHDAGRHDDQAIALALGTYHLLDQGDNGARPGSHGRDGRPLRPGRLSAT